MEPHKLDQQPESILLRTHARFHMAGEAYVKAFVALRDKPDAEAPTEILDLSQGGAKLGLREPLPIKAQVRLRLVSEALASDVNLDGNVCWSRPAGNGLWWMGCAFDEPIPDEQIDELAMAGGLERRRESRSPQDATAFVRWELAPEPVKVRLVDLSRGGFALIMPSRPAVGDRLSLCFEIRNAAEVPIMARVQWFQVHSNGYIVGCTFLGRDEFTACRQRIEIHNPQSPAPTPQSMRYWAAILLGVVTAAVSSFILRYV